MPPYEKTKSLLARYGLAPSKTRGQNFLVNSSTAERIVLSARFDPDDCIIEVGVGLGALTLPLAQHVSKVIGIEVDSGIIRYHEKEKTLPANVSLLHADVLQTDLGHLAEKLGTRLNIIANLPYSISNPFIFKLIDNRMHVEQVVVMLQKEVCDRLGAAPGTKDYGIPTVLLGSCATVEKLMIVKPAEFHPRPKIDSQVMRIVFDENSPETCGFNSLQKIVRASFHNRRKTLLNNLVSSSWIRENPAENKQDRKESVKETIRGAGLLPQMRAEVISIAQFQHLGATFEKAGFI